jgi:hypothetical protein
MIGQSFLHVVLNNNLAFGIASQQHPVRPDDLFMLPFIGPLIVRQEAAFSSRALRSSKESVQA